MAKEVAARDRADSERTVAPLRPADDAIIIDTENRDLDQTVQEVLEIIRARA
jgi:cytidylate kinase